MSNARKLSNLIVGTEVKVSGVDSDLTNIVSTLKTRFDSDDTRLQSILSTFESKVSTIKSRLDSDDSKLQALNTALEAGIVNLVDSDLIISQIQAKINSIVSNIDSDSTALQTANTQITTIKSRLDSDSSKLQSLDTTIVNIKSRLDSDSTAIQAVASIADTASRAGGLGDSDLKVVSDLRNQLDSEILFVRNITLSYTDYVYTATAGQTDFTGSDDNSLTLSYTANQILVFLNGIKLEADDFTATDGTKVTLTDPAGVNNEIIIVCPKFESNYVPPVIIDWSSTTLDQAIEQPSVESSDRFGRSVDMDGSYLIVGVIGGGSSSHGEGQIYYDNGSSWSFQALLNFGTNASSDRMGNSVAISGDVAYVAADGHNSNRGRVVVYNRSGTSWTAISNVSGSSSGAYLGREIKVSGDTLIVGQMGDSSNKGNAKIYTGNLTLQATLTASDGSSGHEFGRAVDIHGDVAVVGSRVVDTSQGAVYIYTRSGTSWTQVHKLTDVGGSAYKQFGSSVAVFANADGTNTIAVYSEYATGADRRFCFFKGSGTSYTKQGEFLASDYVDSNHFTGSPGRPALSIDKTAANNGDVVVIGAPGAGNGSLNDSGSAYILKRTGSTWSQVKRLEATTVGPSVSAEFGNAIKIQNQKLLVAAQQEDNTQPSGGAVYVYEASTS